jgi:hypothetical protein
MEIPRLRPAGEVIGTARAILAHEQARLADRLGGHELVLVDAYNALKLRYRDRPEEYERRKSAFFDMLMARR